MCSSDLNGQFWMRNSSEFRSGAVASSLSEILETGPVDRRYFLSPKACKGILRRAANRGKSLPPSLREALEAVALDQTSTATGGAIEVCMSTGQGSAEIGIGIGIGIGTTLNCNHESPIITAPLTQNPYADNESRESLLVTHSLSADGFDASEDGTGRGTPLVPIAFDCKASGRNGFGIGVGAVAIGWSEELTASRSLAGTVQRGGLGGRHAGVMTPSMEVRRFTPRECERLQGVPDDYTKIPHPKYVNKGDKFRTPEKFLADGPRYRMLGNGFAVPVVRWIGERIAKAVK